MAKKVCRPPELSDESDDEYLFCEKLVTDPKAVEYDGEFGGDSDDEIRVLRKFNQLDQGPDTYLCQLSLKFDWQLDEDETEKYQYIEAMLVDEDNYELGRDKLWKWFEESSENLFGDNPYVLTLKLFLNTGSYKNPKPTSLAYKLVVLLKEWLSKQDTKKQNFLKELLTDNVKYCFFKLSYYHFSLFNIVKDLYDLRKSSKLFVADIQRIVREKKYTEASRLIIEFDLCDQFEIDDVLMPLILQGKNPLAESYFKKCSHENQRDLLMLLNRFLRDESLTPEMLVRYIEDRNIEDCSKGLAYKAEVVSPLLKLIKRLITYTTGITLEDLPFVYRIDSKERLKSLLRNGLITKICDESTFRRSIIKIVKKDDKEFQKIFFEYCVTYCKVREVKEWADYFERDINELFPKEILESKLKEEAFKKLEKNSEKSQIQLFKLRESVAIIHIKNHSAFGRMLKELQQTNLIGIDMEGELGNNNVCLIQIATANIVYIVDLVLIDFSPDNWIEFGHKIFDNPKLLKLGFQIDSDAALVHFSTSNIKVDTRNGSFLDLKKIWELCVDRSFKLPYEDEASGQCQKSDLKTLCEHALNMTLKKEMRYMDWTVRPLPKSQYMYAVTDAACLIDIYRVLKEILNDNDINIDVLTDL